MSEAALAMPSARLATVPPAVRVLHRANIFESTQIDRALAPGRTISGILEELRAAGDLHPALFDIDGRPRPGMELQVYICDAAMVRRPALVHPEYWHLVRPNAGTALSIQLIPGKGDGEKSPGRTLLMVALIAASAYAAPLIGAAIAGEAAVAAGALSYTLSTAVAGAAINFIGTRLIDTIVPPPSPRLSEASGRFTNQSRSQQFGITGIRNIADPLGPVPRVFGLKRVYPHLAAEPYTEVVGDDIYYRVALTLGYGPLEMSDWRIGTTPIADSPEIEMEIREGRPDDAPLTLFGNQVSTDSYQVDIDSAEPLTLFSRPADEIMLDVSFPQLVAIAEDGEYNSRTVDFRLERRPRGSEEAWEPILTSASPLTPITTVTRTGAPLSERYVDYETEWNVAGAVTVTLSGPANAPIGASDPVERIAYRIYGREKGETIWVLQHDMRAAGSWLIGDATRSFGIAGVSGKQREIRVERAGHQVKRFAGRAGTPIWAELNSESLDAIPAPVAWAYNTADITGSSVTWRVTGQEPTQRLRSFRIPLPYRGSWEIRVTRITGNSRGAKNDAQETVFDDSIVVALKHLITEPPINATGMVQAALRIKGNERFNGQLDRINCLAASILPVYDADAATWSQATSRNQAWCALEVMRGAGNKVPVADAKIDLDSFADLATWCDRQAPHSDLDDAVNPDEAAPRPYFAYDHIIDYRSSWYRKVQDILATCRAMMVFRNGKWTAVIDKQQTLPVAHYAAENVYNFRRQLTFSRLPHALRVRYEGAEGNIDEVIVYQDGYGSHNATRFEVLELEGCSSPDQAWREGKTWFAIRQRRRARSFFQTDIEHLAGGVGQLVYVNHHVPNWGRSSARIVSVTMDGDDVESITLDSPVAMEEGQTYCIRIRTKAQGSVSATITTVAGESLTVTPVVPIAPSDTDDPDTTPGEGDLVQFGLVGFEKANLLIRKITRLGDHAAELELVDEAPGVYTADTEALPDASRPLARLKAPPPGAVQDLLVTETVRRLGPREAVSDLVVTWRPAEGGIASTYAVYDAIDGASPVLIDLVEDRTLTIRDAGPERRHRITVVAVGPSGSALDVAGASAFEITPNGLLAAPAVPVANLTFANGTVTINITPAGDADSHEVEIEQPVSVAVSLGGTRAATRVVEFEGTSFPIAAPLAGTYTFRVRARNYQGSRSAAVTMTVTNAHPWAANSVSTEAVSTASGTFDGGMCRTGAGDIHRPSLAGTDWSGVPASSAACVNYNGLWDLADVPMSELKQVPLAWFAGPQLGQTATWTSDIVDVGQVFSGVWSVDFRAEVLDKSAFRNWLDVPMAYLATLNLSALVADDAAVSVALVVGEESDLSDGITVEGHWEGDARYARVVITASTASAVVEAYVSDITVMVDGPDITESGKATIVSSPVTVTFAKTYQDIPDVVITQVDGTGVQITSVGQTSFTATGSGSDAFHYHVKGH